MRRALKVGITVSALLLIGGGCGNHRAHADTANLFDARVQEGEKACWSSPQLQPTSPRNKGAIVNLSMAVQYQLEAYPEHDPARRLLFYALTVSFRDGTKRTATGNCLTSGAEIMTCAVECDGGGVDIAPSPGGALQVSLNRTGFIRIGQCGHNDGFKLTSAEHGDKFVLHAIPAAQCPDLVQPDPNAGID